MKITERAWAVFDTIITALMVLAGAIIIFDTLAVSVDVILRYTLSITYAGLFEITEYSLLWMTFLGTAWLLKTDGHIRVDLLLNRLSPRARTITIIISSVIGILLLAFITWYSALLTWKDYHAEIIIPTYLKPAKWPLEIIIPFGYLLLLIGMLRKAHGYLTGWKAISKGEQMPSDNTPGGEI